jgi:hypothetical protein
LDSEYIVAVVAVVVVIIIIVLIGLTIIGHVHLFAIVLSVVCAFDVCATVIFVVTGAVKVIVLFIHVDFVNGAN